MLHCWKDRRQHIEEQYGFGSDAWVETFAEDWKPGTCMLPDGHSGEHDFTDDGDIGVTFVDDEIRE